MIRLAISVEGQTEESFVDGVLAGHLRPIGVAADPILIGRAREGGQGGGGVRVERLVSDMVRLRQSFDAVTSLVDFYGFRDKGDRTAKAPEEHLDGEIHARLPGAERVFSYVQRHEFEALLFSDVAAFRALGERGVRGMAALAAARRQFATPEDINDTPEGAPGARIGRAAPGFRKRLHGPLVARETGLEKIRGECPRFAAWLARLEGLARVGRTAAP